YRRRFGPGPWGLTVTSTRSARLSVLRGVGAEHRTHAAAETRDEFSQITSFVITGCLNASQFDVLLGIFLVQFGRRVQRCDEVIQRDASHLEVWVRFPYSSDTASVCQS